MRGANAHFVLVLYSVSHKSTIDFTCSLNDFISSSFGGFPIIAIRRQSNINQQCKRVCMRERERDNKMKRPFGTNYLQEWIFLTTMFVDLPDTLLQHPNHRRRHEERCTAHRNSVDRWIYWTSRCRSNHRIQNPIFYRPTPKSMYERRYLHHKLTISVFSHRVLWKIWLWERNVSSECILQK